MAIESRSIRKTGILVLLVAFAFVSLVLPLLSGDVLDAITVVAFTLIFILAILITLSAAPQPFFSAAYRPGIRLRSPPIC
jgi:hypothetical protein